MAIYNPDAPKRLPLSRREKLIRAVGVIVLLGTTAWLLANWGSLPVRLPSHYGFGGEIDGWSGRGSLGLLLGIGWGVWLLLAVTRYFPRGWSFSGLPVTDRTRPMLYCLMGEMLTEMCIRDSPVNSPNSRKTSCSSTGSPPFSLSETGRCV